MQHPLPINQLPPQVAKVCGPDAPPKLKAMAAEGLAPLLPTDLITALYALAYGDDEVLAKKAATSLGGLPDNVLGGALDQLDNPHVLDGVMRMLATRSTALDKAVLNRALADETAHWIATKAGDERTLEIIAANQERLLRHPAIIEALYKNNNTRMSTVDRTVELAVRHGIELHGIACFNEVKAAIEGELIVEPTEEPSPDDIVFNDNLSRDEWLDFDEEDVDEAFEARELGLDDENENSDRLESLEQSLSKLTISAKIRCATLGSAAQRAVLVRDSNKLVSMAVIKSPGIKDAEVVQYSRFRSLPEDALRYMASNREWTKHYKVKLNLVQNPRCPIEYSMRFLNHLRANDVRQLERDKNVPGAISTAAKRLRAKRTGNK